MNTAELKARLEAEKIQLEGELNSLGLQNPANPKDWEATPGEHSPEADPNDVADTSEALQENQAILNDLEVRYNHVLHALKKTDDNAYGICEISGETIESDRLDANPAARTCKAHLDEEEKLPV